MKASLLLLDTLDDLRNEDFKTFKWYLSMDILDGCKRIPKSFLEDASRIDTVSRMTERYGHHLAVRVCIAILKEMNINYEAEMLEEKYAATGGKTASTTSSSSASAPPSAPASISAVDGGVVVAPTITGCTVGSLNITIN